MAEREDWIDWYFRFNQIRQKPQVFSMGVLSKAHRMGREAAIMAIANDNKWCLDKRRAHAKGNR